MSKEGWRTCGMSPFPCYAVEYEVCDSQTELYLEKCDLYSISWQIAKYMYVMYVLIS